MKFLKSLMIAFLSFTSIVQAMSKDEAKIYLKTIANDCIAKVGAEAVHLEEMFSDEKNPSESSKCLRNCLMRQFGMITTDGELSKEGVTDMAKAFVGENVDVDNMMGIVSEIVDKCNTLNDPNPCESAFKYCHCMVGEVASRKLDLSFV